MAVKRVRALASKPSLEEERAMPRKKPSSTPVSLEDVAREINEVETQLINVSNGLANPELPFAASVRLSVQQRELQAYIHGILFAIGEAPSWRTTLKAEAEDAQYMVQR